MQNIAVFRKVANMSTFCISAQYESQRALNVQKVAVNDFVGFIWIQTKMFTPKYYSELQRNVGMFFEK